MPNRKGQAAAEGTPSRIYQEAPADPHTMDRPGPAVFCRVVLIYLAAVALAAAVTIALLIHADRSIGRADLVDQERCVADARGR